MEIQRHKRDQKNYEMVIQFKIRDRATSRVYLSKNMSPLSGPGKSTRSCGLLCASFERNASIFAVFSSLVVSPKSLSAWRRHSSLSGP